MDKLIRIPRTFADDHRDRALPMPTVYAETARYYWIRPKRTAALQSLIKDARFYWETRNDDQGDYRALGLAAGRLLKALGEEV